MRILIVTPTPPRSLQGNAITALRWKRILRHLGHRVSVLQQYEQQAADLMIALHARKSAASVRRFARRWPDRPLVVALTGTDLYQDLGRSATAARSLALATRVVLLQSDGARYLPEDVRRKAVVIYQSAAPPKQKPRVRPDLFEVSVVGHLRPVKDPLRAARAVRDLPRMSRIRVIHIGAALSDRMRTLAEAEMRTNPRYRWLGEMSHAAARKRLWRSRLLVVTSRSEGGANVISEAIIGGVPVISSRISGSIGLLGEDYAGYFSVGDTTELQDLLWRAESDRTFYRELAATCRALRTRFRPERELASWKALLEEL